MACFAQYGFKRTSMADIAEASDMSRAALYQHYRNKEDIFRSIAASFFAAAQVQMAQALAAPDAPPEEQLAAAFAAKDGTLMEMVLSSPHGGELLDTGFSVSADIVAAGERAMTALLADWFAGQELPPGLGPAPELATTVMAALKGLKASAQNYAAYRAGQMRLARMIGLALRGEQPQQRA